jgi:hypothetical protein
VQEPVQRRRGGDDAGEEREGGSRWNLKWCELSGMELKMYVDSLWLYVITYNDQDDAL